MADTPSPHESTAITSRAGTSTTQVFLAIAAVVLLLGVGFVAGALVADDDDRTGWMMQDDRSGLNGMMGGSGMMGGGAGMMGDGTGMWGGGAGMMGGMMDGSMQEMMQSMNVTSEAEYLAGMIPHHEEAIESAKVLRDGTDRDDIREFAEDIISTQQAEVDDMEAWLERWHPGTKPSDDDVPMMREGLDELEGAELDEAFLQDMVMHHMMAIHMSQNLLARDLAKHDDVEQLARSIISTQRSEIFQMRRWLAGA